MTYYNEEFDDSLNDTIIYLNNLSIMNNEELKKELYEYKKILNTLIKECKSEKLKYFIYITICRFLNTLTDNSYKPIIDKINEFKCETSYEKTYAHILRQILNKLKKEPTTDDVECFYLSLASIVALHNKRFIYSNNILDNFSSNFKGITVDFPAEDDSEKEELKSSIEDSIKYFTKKIN